MIFSCLVLIVTVMFPGVPYGSVVMEEKHYVRECVINADFSNTPNMGEYLSPCEMEAHRLIKGMQFAGILPGAKEIISYSATCDTGI